MVVIDACLLVELLLQTPNAGLVEERLFKSGDTLHAPYLIDIEVTQALRRFAISGTLPQGERSRAALDILIDFPVQRYPHRLLLPRIWDLRHNLTAYDAAYVALAEALDAPLLTRDRRLAVANGHRATIEVI